MVKKSPEEMSLIEYSKEGRKDGGYTRIFDDSDLGALFSRVQGTVISSGNALEGFISGKMILKDRIFKDFIKFEDLSTKIPGDGLYLLDISIMKKYDMLPKNQSGSLKKQDFYIIDNTNNKLFITEIKDGDTFDTKKANGEKNALDLGLAYFNMKLPDFEIIPLFVSFNQDDEKTIYDGAKKILPQKWCMSGRNFCDLLDLDFEEIISIRSKMAERNKNFFLEQLKTIIK